MLLPNKFDEVPTLQEKESAENIFKAMVEGEFDVLSMSRILKHLSSVLILYSQEVDKPLLVEMPNDGKS
tara:strand:+ start:54 stop:260 length:207 start_codon:yes stop_codon:yes gene_type:complete